MENFIDHPKSLKERTAAVIGDERMENAGRKRLRGLGVAAGLVCVPTTVVASDSVREWIEDIGNRVEKNYDHHNTDTELPENPSDMTVVVDVTPTAP